MGLQIIGLPQLLHPALGQARVAGSRVLRTLQRLRPFGGRVTVVSTLVTVAVASDTGRPDRGASSSPASRSLANRRRQTPTVCGVVSSSAAMSWLSHCWAASKTMRARKTLLLRGTAIMDAGV